MIVLQALTSIIFAALNVRAASPEVRLGKTTLIGRDVTLLRQDFFGGIPFAEPPLGSLRLQPPVLKTSLNTTTFDASNFGFSCLQSGIPIAELSEDCLTINVFRPSGVESSASLPVMFWTYGGGFQEGTSAEFNASAIVAQSVARGTPVVYVNFNYRLGPLGFPQGQEAANRKVLNLALHDQIAALTWVQENIGAFGGDKNKVTVFGESAGAIMTAVQFLNPSFANFARAAIFESGSAASALTFNAQHRQIDWDNFVAGVPGCAELSKTENTFSCLQSVNTTAILSGLLVAQNEAPEEFPWSPTIDGEGGFIPELPSLIFAKGTFAKIPFISGTNLDEGTLFIPPTTDYTAEVITDLIIANFSPPAVPSVSENQLENAATRLLELYPDIPALGSPFNTGNDTFGLSPGYKRISALFGDLSFQSQRRLWIQTASNAGVKTFSYLFTQPQPTNPAFLGVSHGTEIAFVYGAPPNATASAIGLSEAMIDYWVSFATSLNPNDGKGIPRLMWEQYTPQNQVVIQLNGDNTTMIPDDYREAGIAFINSMPLTFHHRRSL
ncbi:extracellular triacylglycerol lipase precursor [Lentinula edodes]|uniref:Carboxylic ester hydrolase n=1 Tax=Lentinula edodes TaxID=5353 RepID=A0A1Q3E6E1_LENED|nr:esterase 1 [Lentinula edodes]KAH7875027.1 esterase 1 [Lentinula edodes]KAJ3901094.1 extracellular triacylglycerol lipase precursor [Lentinula edodes]KAJ3914356.1 extracellular triacylglycerol lipase precursor [Lentinula edodes]GAW02803.1 extracellular triacylglycerol lipase precursor [Lentinula edodes]